MIDVSAGQDKQRNAAAVLLQVSPVSLGGRPFRTTLAG
jgi:hypothetical protein